MDRIPDDGKRTRTESDHELQYQDEQVDEAFDQDDALYRTCFRMSRGGDGFGHGCRR